MAQIRLYTRWRLDCGRCDFFFVGDATRVYSDAMLHWQANHQRIDERLLGPVETFRYMPTADKVYPHMWFYRPVDVTTASTAS